MMNFEGQPAPIENAPESELTAQEQLKERYLKGIITGDTLLEQLLELDQSMPERDDAGANIDVLEDPDIYARLTEGDMETREVYLHHLSLYHFHVAQQQAMAGAIPDEELSKAFEAIRQVEDAEAADPWKTYVEATIAYFKNDIEALTQLSGSIEGPNQKVVERLLAGLREHGGVNYERDYARA